MYRYHDEKIKPDRIAALARLGQEIVHTRDLANLWHIKDRNTLYTALTRYVKRGILFRLQKGMYALKPMPELDPWVLGIKTLHRFGYISTETMLAEHGIIAQKISSITLISNISTRFSFGSQQYLSRKLNDAFLYNPAGIIEQKGVKIATISRAVADLLYFNPRAYFDGAHLIDWDAVRRIQYEMGYPATPKFYDTSRPKRRRA